MKKKKHPKDCYVKSEIPPKLLHWWSHTWTETCPKRTNKHPFISMQMRLRGKGYKKKGNENKTEYKDSEGRLNQLTRKSNSNPENSNWCCFFVSGKIATLKTNPYQVSDQCWNKILRGKKPHGPLCTYSKIKTIILAAIPLWDLWPCQSGLITLSKNQKN